MKLVLMFGPQAVGKMTVGHELEKITGLKLFHNHMTIDLVVPFIGYDTDIAKKLVKNIRHQMFEAFAKSEMEGIIFTYMWCLERQDEWDEVEKFSGIFRKNGAEIYYVELEADVEERLRRNKTPHRLEHKPSKRNIEWSENDLITSVGKHRMNSFEGEIKEKNFVKINNTNLVPEEVAKMIKERFQL